MNATTYPQSALRFIAVSTPARRLIVAQPANPAPAILAVSSARDEPFAESDAPGAGAVPCPRPPRDNLACYAAPAAPALFHVC